MAICATTSSLKILRCNFAIKSGNTTNKERNEGCSDYIIPEPVNLGDNRNFCYTFKANKKIEFAHPDLDGLQKIGFYFYIDSEAEERERLGIAAISVQLTPPDFNPLLYPEQIVSQMDNATFSELKNQWNFVLGMSGYVALVIFYSYYLFHQRR